MHQRIHALCPLRPTMALALALLTGSIWSAEAASPLGGPAPDPVKAVLVPSWRLRDDALAALATQDAAKARTLAETWVNAKDARLRGAGVRLGALVGADKMMPLFAALARDKQVEVRLAVADAVGAMAFVDDKDHRSHELLDVLATLATDADVRVRVSAVQKLGRCVGSKAAVGALLACCQDAPEEVADQAVAALIALRIPKLLETLAPHLGEPAVQNRVLAANALGRIGGAAAVKSLLSGLAASDAPPMWEARAAICDALAQIGPTDAELVAKAEKPLLPLLKDRKWGVRCAAAWALGRMGSRALLPNLVAGADPLDGEPFRTALRGMTDKAWTTADEWKTWWSKENKGFQLKPLVAPPEASTISFMSISDSTTNVVFVIDHSGSMAETGLISPYHQKDKIVRSKLDMAKQELMRTTMSLNPGTRFNVVLFSGGVETWNVGPVHATWRVKGKLKDYLDGVGPAGATDTSDALETGLDQWGVETVFFLTDGMPTAGELDTSRIVQDVVDRNAGLTKPAKVHAIAFFIAQAQGFLSGLAARNAGTYRLEE